jgi:hypothetical protein
VAAQGKHGVGVGAGDEQGGVGEVEAVVAGPEAAAQVVGEQLRLAVEEHRRVAEGGLPSWCHGTATSGTRRWRGAVNNFHEFEITLSYGGRSRKYYNLFEKTRKNSK